jgi:hypothetical protein
MNSNSEIFFSYAWGDEQEKSESREKIVDELYKSLLDDHYNVVRDKYNLEYKGFITDFMTRIGEGKCIIVAISRKYLKSPYCMFELYEIARNSKFDKTRFKEIVIPVIVERVDFTDPAVIDDHFLFWENEYNEWSGLVAKRPGQLSVEQLQRFDKIKMIYQNFGRLAEWIADMNTLNPQILSADNFAAIKKEIGKKEKERVGFLRRPVFWLSFIVIITAIAVIASWLRDTPSAHKLRQPLIFHVVRPAGEGLLIVQDLHTQKFGFALDKDTTLFISAKYEESNPFHEGMALVKMNGKYQWIKPDSTNAFPGSFDHAENFQDGRARVMKGLDTFFINEKGERLPLSVTPLQKNTTNKQHRPTEAEAHDGKNESATVKMCTVICNTKGISGVEVSFFDPKENKRYAKVSGDGDLGFEVPCYLRDQVIEVKFMKNHQTEARNFILKNMEIPEMFKN